MSDDFNLKRRTVLKTASTSVLFGGIGTVRGMETDESESVNLVEAGIHYSLPDGFSYDDYHIDTMADYWLDYDSNRLVLRKDAPRSTRSLVRSSQNLVNAGELASSVAPVTESDGVRRLPTELSSRYRTSGYVSLDDPITQPTVEVRYQGADPVLRVDGTERRLPAGEEVAVSLEPITAIVRTRRVTDEKADIPGVPDRKLGYEIERGTVDVAAVPEVVATNHGRLNVAEFV